MDFLVIWWMVLDVWDGRLPIKHCTPLLQGLAWGFVIARSANFANAYNAAILGVTVGAIWGSVLALVFHALLLVAIKN